MTTLINNAKKFAIATSAFLSTTLLTPAFATSEDPKEVKVTYVCELNDMPVYQVSVNNATEATYTIKIKDDTGNILHVEKTKGTNIVRNFQFKEEGLDTYSLVIEVYNAKNKLMGSYKVSKTQKTVEDVVVKKID